MTDPLYTRTNQKLYFAGLALKVAAQATDQGERQAAFEGVVFHLYGALLALCREVADSYRLPEREAVQLEDILCPEVLQRSPNPELAELAVLLEQQGGWLNGLLCVWTGLFSATPPRVSTTVSSDLIPVAIEGRMEDLSQEKLQQWRDHIRELALRFRQSLTEI